MSSSTFLDRLTYSLLTLFALDRLLKLLAAIHFFRRPRPTAPSSWPTVTLLQPITRGASNLYNSLRTRALLQYPAKIQHLLICDVTDTVSQTLISSYLAEFPTISAEIVLVATQDGRKVASKMSKLQAALPHADGEVLCFIDDDVALRPDTLHILLPYLFQPAVGVAFGLPCFTNWQTIWSSLISGLVNAHLLLSFVALTYLSNPFRINGHIFAFRRAVFEQIGGLDGLEQQIDDEYEIAHRVRTHHLLAVQTPLIYDIDNALDSLEAYTKQFKRWFVMPRQAMFPVLPTRERLIATLSSMTLPIPSVIALLALFTRRRSTLSALSTILTLFVLVYVCCEQRFLQRHTPLHRWPLLSIVALWTPLHIIWTLLLSNEVEWRGQRLRLHQNGTVEIIS